MYAQEKWVYMYTKTYVKNINSNFIYNSFKLEIIKISISGKMDKESVVNLHGGIPNIYFF